MGLAIKEINMLLRLSASQDALAKALKGGKGNPYEQQRLEVEAAQAALEKAHGGVQRLRDAEAIAVKMVAEAEAKTTAWLDDANRTIMAGKSALQAQEDRVIKARNTLDVWNDKLIVLAEEAEAVAKALVVREDVAMEREDNAQTREDAITGREQRVTAREQAIEARDRKVKEAMG